ncbi:MAG: GAF domain-containing sensor histidine kinase [Anaerolineaceae bacterium]|nr:GAF domain-containing sensor histidine kinase [Anaerolineaceae bacterium]
MENPKDQQLEDYQQLVEISIDMASNLDLDSLLRKIIEAAMDLSDASAASILLFDQEKRQLYFQITEDIETEAIFRGIIVPEESIAGWVATNRKPLIISNIEKDDRHFEGVDQITNFSTNSMIAVPMIAKEKLIGVLEVLNKVHGNFTEEEQDKMMILASQAAVAIENTRLFQQSDLIAELVHELRTPLSSIMTISHLLQKSELTSTQRVELSKTITRESQRMNELASNFLDFARLESGRVEFNRKPFSIRELIDECVAINLPKAAENGISVHSQIQEDLPRLHADQSKIKQVILNLLSNAIKYNKPGGDIRIMVSENDGSMILEFQDTGFGIPSEEIPNLFEKFFRVKEVTDQIKGTGLGLSISKRIIENHGGNIRVESEYGQGTTFIIQLPLKK